MEALNNIDYSNKPKVVISLEPILQNFCRFIFNTDPAERYVRITRKILIGKLIYSTVLTSDIPVKRPSKTNEITFVLPITKEGGYILRWRHIYIPGWAEEKLQDNLEWEFKKWVRERFEIGYEKKFTQKEIIETILRALNVRNNAANFDTIKKIDYRNRRRLVEKRFNDLLTA